MEKFNKYDVDGDGHICSGELVTWVFGPKNEDDSEVQKSVKCSSLAQSQACVRLVCQFGAFFRSWPQQVNIVMLDPLPN